MSSAGTKEIDLDRRSLKEWPDLRKLLPAPGTPANIRLRMRDNQLRAMPDSVAALTQLISLDLHGNQLESVNVALRALTQLLVLDLSQNKLTSVPSGALQSLRSLRVLSFEGNALESLPELPSGCLTQLEWLVLSGNALRSLPASLFKAVRSVRVLDLAHNQLSELPREIGHLTALTRLDLSGNALAQLPPQIGLCTSLCTLQCGLNQLTVLPAVLARLTRLEQLSASGNRLVVVPTNLGTLTQLQRIELADNQLTSLPPSLASLSLTEAQIDVANNRLVSPPQALVRSGGWLAYLRDMLQQAANCYRAKVMLVGKENVGKTSLREAFAHRKKRSAINLSTDGVDIETLTCAVQIDGAPRSVRLNVWDFAGQDIYYTSHQLFLSECAIYLVVWDMRYDFDDAAHNNVGFWLRNIVARAGRDVPIIVVGTHIDHSSCTDEAVNSKMLQLSSTYGPIYPNIKSYRAVSTTKGDGIEALFHQVGQCARALPGMGASVPASYLALEEVLASLTATTLDSKQRAPALAWDEWSRVALACSIGDDEQLRRATRHLHNVGSIIYYESDGHVSDLVIVEPQWLTKCIATVLTTKHRAVRPDGILTSQMLQQIWRAPDYPPELHGHLRALLERFEIMHPVRSLLSGGGTGGGVAGAAGGAGGGGAALAPLSMPPSPQRLASPDLRVSPKRLASPDVGATLKSVGLATDDYLVASMLPEARPAVVDELFSRAAAAAATKLFTRLYSFDFLPIGLLSRFLIRCADLATLRAYWRSGFAATRGSARLLVEVRGDAMRIQTAGDGASELLREASATLQSFVAAWFKVPYKVEVECVHCTTAGDDAPFLFPLKHCENVVAGGKSHVMCRGRFPVRLDRLVPDVAMSDLASARINDADLVLGERIASGSYGDVCAATYQGRSVAVKQMRADKASVGYADFRSEVWCMAGLDHPNIVNMIGYSLSPPALVLDLVRGGDLFNFIHTPALAATLDWPLLVRMAYEIALGMRYLHSVTPPILHHDLKTPNILLAGHTLAEPSLCKITDFGTAQRLYAGRMQEKGKQRAVTNPTWLAPEIINELPYTVFADVYSYGIILWELITCELPFAEFNLKFMHMIEDVVKAGRRPTIPPTTSPLLAALVNACWHATPEQRPLFSNICQQLSDNIVPEVAPGLVLVDYQSSGGLADGSAASDDALAGGVPQVSGELVRQLVPSPPASPCTLAYVPHGRQVWGGCTDGRIIVWSVDNGAELGRLGTEHAGAVLSIRLFDGAVWCASADGVLSVWRANMIVDESLLRRSGPLLLGGSRAGEAAPRQCVLDVNRLVLLRDDATAHTDGSVSLSLCNAGLDVMADTLQFSVRPVAARAVMLRCADRTDFDIWTALLRDAINAASRSVALCLQTLRWADVKGTVRYTVIPVDPSKARGRSTTGSGTGTLPRVPSTPAMAAPAAAARRAPAKGVVSVAELPMGVSLNAFVVVHNEVWASGNDSVLRVFDKQTRAPRDSYWLDVSGVMPAEAAVVATMQRVRGLLWVAVGAVIVRLDLTTRTAADFLVGHKAPIRDMRATAGGEVWSCAADNAVRVWSALSGECMRRIDFSTSVTSLLPVGDALWVACGINIDVWDTSKYERRKRMVMSRDDTRHMLLVSNKSVWSVHDDRMAPVRVWN